MEGVLTHDCGACSALFSCMKIFDPPQWNPIRFLTRLNDYEHIPSGQKRRRLLDTQLHRMLKERTYLALPWRRVLPRHAPLSASRSPWFRVSALFFSSLAWGCGWGAGKHVFGQLGDWRVSFNHKSLRAWHLRCSENQKPGRDSQDHVNLFPGFFNIWSLVDVIVFLQSNDMNIWLWERNTRMKTIWRAQSTVVGRNSNRLSLTSSWSQNLTRGS